MKMTFDGISADMVSNKIIQQTVIELFIRVLTTKQ